MESRRHGVVIALGVAVAAFFSTTATGFADEAAHERELHEMRTPSNAMFYTISEREAGQAESKHGFRPTDEEAGLAMYDRRLPGTVPVHRLRLVGGSISYILTSSERELERLRNDKSDPWNFQYEGVVGYVHSKPVEGTVAVSRFSKNNDWRIARSSRQDLTAAGYRNDGIVGYAPVIND